MSRYESDIEDDVISEEEVKEEEEIEEPSMYKVLLHNDDYTPMNFVVEILIVVFNKPIEDATRIMLNVHRQGIGVCGIYTYEVAETKINTVDALAGERGFPLKCTMEEE